MSKWAAIDDHGKMHGYLWSGGHERRTQVTQAVGSIREGTFELACYLFERGSQRDWAKVKKTVDRMGAMLQGGLIYACRTKPRNNFILGNSTWHKRLRFIVREIPLPSAKLEHLTVGSWGAGERLTVVTTSSDPKFHDGLRRRQRLFREAVREYFIEAVDKLKITFELRCHIAAIIYRETE